MKHTNTHMQKVLSSGCDQCEWNRLNVIRVLSNLFGNLGTPLQWRDAMWFPDELAMIDIDGLSDVAFLRQGTLQMH